ncbi:MAG: hypothetical protein FJX61_16995 [Alphaproteobacteria bacterium]|nr:hypothetical protein [Alphaproteobacteria bacterium]
MLKKFAAVAVAAGAIAGFAADALAQQDVKIGYSIGRTGLLGPAVAVQEQAYILWQEQVNAKGGLNIGGKEKRKIGKFISYDDQSDQGKIPQIYEKLITDDKVDLLLAPYATYLHVAITNVIEKHKFPLVGNTASSVLVRDLKARYMFFSELLPDAYSKTLVDFLKSEKITSAAMFTLQLTFNLEMKKFSGPLMKEAGIKLLVDQEYPPDLKDMTSIVNAIKQAKPDAVLGFSYPGDSVMYMDKGRELKIDSPTQFLLIGPSIPFFAPKFGKNLEGMLSIGHWSPNAKFNGAKAFNDAYQARWKEPPDYLDSVIAYVSCQILEAAVAKAGLDKEGIRNAIAADTFDTIMGPVKFTNNNNATTSPGILQFQNGINQIVWPPEIATAKYIKKPAWQ